MQTAQTTETITLRIAPTSDNKRFQRLVKAIKAWDGRYDPATKTWTITITNNDRIVNLAGPSRADGNGPHRDKNDRDMLMYDLGADITAERLEIVE